MFDHARTIIKMEEINDRMRLLEFNDRFARLENEGLLPPLIIFKSFFHHRLFSLFRNNYTLYNNNNSVSPRDIPISYRASSFSSSINVYRVY